MKNPLSALNNESVCGFCTDYVPHRLTSWEFVAIILGATLIICFTGTSTWYYCQRRKRLASGRPFAKEDSVYDPILNGNTTIHDIIEMTTSGSGSGEFHGVSFQLQFGLISFPLF